MFRSKHSAYGQGSACQYVVLPQRQGGRLNDGDVGSWDLPHGSTCGLGLSL